jgi:hypothetical protein
MVRTAASGRRVRAAVGPLLAQEATIHAIRRVTDRKAFRCIEGNVFGAPRCMPLQSVTSRRNDAGRYCRHPDGIGAIKLEAAPRYHALRCTNPQLAAAKLLRWQATPSFRDTSQTCPFRSGTRLDGTRAPPSLLGRAYGRLTRIVFLEPPARMPQLTCVRIGCSCGRTKTT